MLHLPMIAVVGLLSVYEVINGNVLDEESSWLGIPIGLTLVYLLCILYFFASEMARKSYRYNVVARIEISIITLAWLYGMYLARGIIKAVVNWLLFLLK